MPVLDWNTVEIKLRFLRKYTSKMQENARPPVEPNMTRVLADDFDGILLCVLLGCHSGFLHEFRATPPFFVIMC